VTSASKSGDAASSLLEPLLDVDEIQGNVLAGFRKDHQVLVALEIREVAAAQAWLASFVHEIANTREVMHFNDGFRALKARRGADPLGFHSVWINVAFSAEGLRKLTSDAEVEAIPDEAFRIGLLKRSALLRDPTDETAEGSPANWKVGGPGEVPDVLLIVAGDDTRLLGDTIDRISPSPDQGQPRIIWSEQGDTRSDMPGHEHFGFRDGLSQPGVRGLISQMPDRFLTQRRIDPLDARAAGFSSPGQPLIPPGHFVLGYPILGQDGELAPAPALAHDWFRDGSFLVFRRLRQEVKAFRKFLETEASRLRGVAGFGAMTAELLATMFVGRWPHGAPLMRTSEDDEAMGGNNWANNNFLFDQPSPAVPPSDGTAPDHFPPSPGDQFGRICPHAAHIRKVNPRDEDTEFGNLKQTLVRRILRRGIPFGKSLPDPALEGDNGERGLHFLCYQASIALQFESITRDWANETLTPKPGGHDPIIGQSGSAQLRARTLDLPGPSGEVETINIHTEWVIPTGGGYFFTPSLSAIRTRLCGIRS
jgi:Dyp-type peroxidase family